jgi:predicted dehydrogenase
MTPPWTKRDRVRWGIIGCGDVTEVKSGPALQKAEGSELVAVMRRDAGKARDYARRHGVAKWYSDAEALIRDPDVDAVYVATPPGTHLEYALRVRAACKPACIEKPMARSATECDRMVEAFTRPSLPLFVAFYRRCLPRFAKARKLVDEGTLGKLTGVRYHYAEPRHRTEKAESLPWRLDAGNAGGGLFLDLGSHTLDFLDYVLGPLVQVEGHAANLASPHAVEDTLGMSFRTEAGVPGVASWNFASGLRADAIEFTGTEGRLTLSTFGSEPVRLETSDGINEFDLPNPAHVHQPLVQAMVDDLRGRGRCPSTGETARRTARVMDRVLEAYYGGRGDAFWTRPDTWPGRRIKD